MCSSDLDAGFVRVQSDVIEDGRVFRGFETFSKIHCDTLEPYVRARVLGPLRNAGWVVGRLEKYMRYVIVRADKP